MYGSEVSSLERFQCKFIALFCIEFFISYKCYTNGMLYILLLYIYYTIVIFLFVIFICSSFYD